MQTYAYSDTFVKVDAQIEENCRRNILFLSEIGYSCPKFRLRETEESETYGKLIQFAIQEEQLYAECGASICQRLPFSFRKTLNKARYNIYGNLLPVFSTEGSRLEEK